MSSSWSSSDTAWRRLATKELRARVDRRDRGNAPEEGTGTGEALEVPLALTPGRDSSSMMRSSRALEKEKCEKGR
jgi:hypothetical protein